MDFFGVVFIRVVLGEVWLEFGLEAVVIILGF